jgi:hypothetical protein
MTVTKCVDALAGGGLEQISQTFSWGPYNRKRSSVVNADTSFTFSMSDTTPEDEGQDYDSENELGIEDMEEAEYASRLALLSAQENQQESEAIRKELNAYIDDLTQKKDSQGSTLIKVPSNFGAIVDSMTREDVLGDTGGNGGVAPWSQYLLLDGLNAEGDSDFNGRYTHVFRDTPDTKIRRGLAQIEMLDRQLKEAAKRSSHEQDEKNFGDTESVPDETFVTANRVRGYSPRPQNEPQSARTDLSTKQRKRKKASEKQNERQLQQQWLLDPTAELTEEELQRQLGSFLDPSTAEQLQSIDQQLEQFGHMGRLTAGSGGTDDAEAPGSEWLLDEGAEQDGRSGNVDYLALQRAARKAAEKARQLDNLIRDYVDQVGVSLRYSHIPPYGPVTARVPVTTQPVDYDALVVPGEEAQGTVRGGASVSSRATLLSEVPPAQLVQ